MPTRTTAKITGRPSALTKGAIETGRKVAQAGGADKEIAAKLHVTPRTVMRWFTMGRRLIELDQPDRKGHPPYRVFAETVDEARADLALAASTSMIRALRGSDAEFDYVDAVAGNEVVKLRKMTKMGRPPDWRAAAHLLERRYPEAWGREPTALVIQPTPSDPNLIDVEAEPARALGLTCDADVAELGRLLSQRLSGRDDE